MKQSLYKTCCSGQRLFLGKKYNKSLRPLIELRVRAQCGSVKDVDLSKKLSGRSSFRPEAPNFTLTPRSAAALSSEVREE